MQYLQACELGVVLGPVAFDLSEEIADQPSVARMRDENISCNLHSSLTADQVERDCGKNSNQWIETIPLIFSHLQIDI